LGGIKWSSNLQHIAAIYSIFQPTSAEPQGSSRILKAHGLQKHASWVDTAEWGLAGPDWARPGCAAADCALGVAGDG